MPEETELLNYYKYSLESKYQLVLSWSEADAKC